MNKQEIFAFVLREIPCEPDSHWWWWLVAAARRGCFIPFLEAFSEALANIDEAERGGAARIVARAALLRGLEQGTYDRLLQLACEVYVSSAIAKAAEAGTKGCGKFELEPGRQSNQKNPEVLARVSGKDCAVEVKAPSLRSYRLGLREFQALLPRRASTKKLLKTYSATPAPAKRIARALESANQKFSALKRDVPKAITLLYLIWDDYIQEPVSVLWGVGGILNREAGGGWPSVGELSSIDGVVLDRHQRVLIEALAFNPRCPRFCPREGFPFEYYFAEHPPKAIIQNPFGNPVPREIVEALDLTPIEGLQFVAEYRPAGIIHWRH